MASLAELLNYDQRKKQLLSALQAGTDVINRGTIAGTLGTPVDLANTALQAVGLGSEKPVLGSEWIGDKMQQAGMVSPERRPVAEFAAGFVNPETATTKAAFLAKALAGKSVAGMIPAIKSAVENPSKLAKSLEKAQNLKQVPQYETPEFKAWSNTAPLITSEAAPIHEFKSGVPVTLEAYHGTKRPDRIGDVFLAKRATSGPMAFHTSDPELASGYAAGKQDTSLAYEDPSYESWFKVNVPGYRKPVNLDQAWHSFSPEEKQKISSLAPRVGYDDEALNILLHPEGHTSGIGNYDLELKQTQSPYNRIGNPLKALTESWLSSGSLYGEEDRFMEVLKNAGVPTGKVIFDSPVAEYPAVYKNYIKMNKPLVTTDIPPEVEQALNEAAKKDRSRPTRGASDMWDKKNRTLREWVDAFNTPDRSYTWTSIPDKVTDVFRSMGYDGIIDYSGKSGNGMVRPVYIPFGEHQLKSAIGNKGKFDPSKKSLTLGVAAPLVGGSMLMAGKDKDNQ